MRVTLPPQSRVVKKVLPRTLLGRSLLIISLPLVLVLAVALADLLRQPPERGLAPLRRRGRGRVGITIDLLEQFPEEQPWVLRHACDLFDFVATFDARRQAAARGRSPTLRPDRRRPRGGVARPRRQPVPHRLAQRPAMGADRGADDHGTLLCNPRASGSYTGTIYIFVVWLIGTAALLFGIAALFMRNQVRAIRRLAAAAEAFGLGRDTARSSPRARPRCGRRPPRSTACRSASAASCSSARKCWPASRTTCARR